MPFIAIRQETGERIDITRIDHPRSQFKSGECVCQLCGAPMIIKAGMIMSAHFAHSARCESEYATHPESQAHRQAKVYLAHHLSEAFPEYLHASIEYF